MAMNPKCIAAVSQAAGRKLTASEIQGIEDRLSAAMRKLARDDPQAWMAKPYDQKVLEGSQLAMREMQTEARRKLENAQRQIVATAATEQRVKDLQTNMSSGRSNALVEDINNTNLYADGIKRQAMSQLMDLVEATASRQDASLGRRALTLDRLGWKHAVLFGLAQALALVPGVSRSGGTITAGLLRGS